MRRMAMVASCYVAVDVVATVGEHAADTRAGSCLWGPTYRDVRGHTSSARQAAPQHGDVATATAAASYPRDEGTAHGEPQWSTGPAG